MGFGGYQKFCTINNHFLFEKSYKTEIEIFKYLIITNGKTQNFNKYNGKSRKQQYSL